MKAWIKVLGFVKCAESVDVTPPRAAYVIVERHRPAVLNVRDGIIKQIGIATKPLTRAPATRRAFLHGL